MNAAYNDLIDSVIAVVGCDPPVWNGPAAPVLTSSGGEENLYLIGVVGGKDVGKSSLINAILDRPVATVSGHGEGTWRALAYVFREDRSAAEKLLEREIPGQYEIVLHDQSDARRRVLLDLPDIDSIWGGHIEITNRVLRYMLFPIWVQSIEKYADQQPLKLLETVAAGNASDNFMFVLTKADVLSDRHGQEACAELAADYAERVARACRLEERPAVWVVSSRDRDAFDLPGVVERVLSVRSEKDVTIARQSAERRQLATVAQWLREQHVDERLAAVERLLNDATELVNARLAEPLVEQLEERLAGEAAVRSKLIEPVVRERLSYWPIVNVIDGVLGPIVAAMRGGGSTPVGDALAGRAIDEHVRGVFSELSQRDPLVYTLYARRKLWEAGPAAIATATLERAVSGAVSTHGQSLARLGRPSLVVRVLAVVVTIGALVWFPIVQPVLEIVLVNDLSSFTRQTLLLVIQFVGATYLLKSIGFLMIYFVALWMWLRWRTYRKVERVLRRSAETGDPATAVLLWCEQLLEPLRLHAAQLKQLQDKIEALTVEDRQAA